MATVRLLSLHWHLLEASALNTLGAILDFINLRRALPLVTKIRLGIAISTLVSPNRHEPLTEPGDILLDNVGCLLRELRTILSAARVPRQFEFLSLKFPVQPWVRIVIVNDCCKTSDSRAKNELIKFKHSSNGICECATTGKQRGFYNNIATKIRLPPFLHTVSIHLMHPAEKYPPTTVDIQDIGIMFNRFQRLTIVKFCEEKGTRTLGKLFCEWNGRLLKIILRCSPKTSPTTV